MHIEGTVEKNIDVEARADARECAMVVSAVVARIFMRYQRYMLREQRGYSEGVRRYFSVGSGEYAWPVMAVAPAAKMAGMEHIVLP